MCKIFYLTADLTKVGMNKYLFHPSKMIFYEGFMFSGTVCMFRTTTWCSIGCMVGVHEKVSDKPDSFPDHTEINSTAVKAPSINLKAQCRKCLAEVKCCLMIQHDFTAGLVTCSLLMLVVITSPEDIVFINSQEII